MKKFFKAIIEFLQGMSQARAAAALSRAGDYEGARKLMK